jgi:hypothetical protein
MAWFGGQPWSIRQNHPAARSGNGRTAAGQPLRVSPRDCRDYPLELAFFYQGVRFCELKSAAALKNLTDAK